MKRVLLAVVFLVAGFFIVQYFIRKDKESKNISQSLSRHSAGLNQAIGNTLDAYYRMTEAFVTWDSASLDTHILSLKQRLDSVDTAEIARDSTKSMEKALGYLANARNNINTMLAQKELELRKQTLNTFTSNFYAFLDEIHYDRSKLYLQKCPMAFNDTGSGIWLSAGDSIRNPYLGLHHPRYGKGMLECGENEKVLDYTKGQSSD